EAWPPPRPGEAAAGGAAGGGAGAEGARRAAERWPGAVAALERGPPAAGHEPSVPQWAAALSAAVGPPPPEAFAASRGGLGGPPGGGAAAESCEDHVARLERRLASLRAVLGRTSRIGAADFAAPAAASAQGRGPGRSWPWPSAEGWAPLAAAGRGASQSERALHARHSQTPSVEGSRLPPEPLAGRGGGEGVEWRAVALASEEEEEDEPFLARSSGDESTTSSEHGRAVAN
ncbi:unnamed protein product, partial [Prorocentrum cordatum]